VSTQTSSCERARARRCCAAHAPSNPPGAFGNFRIARKLPHHPETSAAGNFRITRKLPDQKRRSVEDRVWLAQPKPPSGWKLPKLPKLPHHPETSASHGNFRTKSAGRSRIGCGSLSLNRRAAGNFRDFRIARKLPDRIRKLPHHMETSRPKAPVGRG
jgi:hypothetical protein